MSIEEFNALYEKSLEAIKRVPEEYPVRVQAVALLSRIRTLVDAGGMDVDEAIGMVKQLVVAASLPPAGNAEPKANAV